MAHETEIKLRITDLKELRTRLKVLGARIVGRGGGAVHEWNVLFDTPEEDLRQHGQLLRIRTETGGLAVANVAGARINESLVTFKRPIDGDDSWRDEEGRQRRHKVREEIELEVSDAASLTKIFEGLGMRGWFRYEKFRTTYQLPKVAALGERLIGRNGRDADRAVCGAGGTREGN